MFMYRIINADRVPNYLSELFYKDYSYSSRRRVFSILYSLLSEIHSAGGCFLAMVLFYGKSYPPVLNEQSV